MAAIVRKNHIEVGNRLEELGLTTDYLLEIVNAMAAARSDCTANDPPSAPGWSSWRHGTRRAREVLAPLGWERDETDQISSVVNAEMGIRIVVSNTDDGTAHDERSPQNRSKKGAATDKVISDNQGSLFDLMSAPQNVVILRTTQGNLKPIITWYLCVYSEGDDILAEFSCPVALEGGFFTDFVERIILLAAGTDPNDPVRRKKDGDTPDSDFDIPVLRKKKK